MSHEIIDAIQPWIGYKGDLEARRSLSGAGYQIPPLNTKEFVGIMNTASARIMSILDCRDPNILESIGEACINARNMLIHPDITSKQY